MYLSLNGFSHNFHGSLRDGGGEACDAWWGGDKSMQSFG